MIKFSNLYLGGGEKWYFYRRHDRIYEFFLGSIRRNSS